MSPTPSPTPKCIGDTWSYDENIQTEININPNLKITMVTLGYDVIYEVVTATPAGESYPTLPAYQTVTTSNPAHSWIPSKITIYGDGRVVGEEKKGQSIKEKRIQIDQLQKIVAVLEEANFYAISWGCLGLECPCGHELDITVETKEMVHEIYDKGACFAAYFDRYCDLWDQINAIIGEF